MTVIMELLYLSYCFCLCQDAIDRVQTLMEDERLTGVMDDRGKFIYITQDEYNAVAKFIRQRGRVSLRALAESSNQLINLNTDTKTMKGVDVEDKPCDEGQESN